jgi:hypothetical protein
MVPWTPSVSDPSTTLMRDGRVGRNKVDNSSNHAIERIVQARLTSPPPPENESSIAPRDKSLHAQVNADGLLNRANITAVDSVNCSGWNRTDSQCAHLKLEIEQAPADR